MMRAINPAGLLIPQTSQAMLVSGDNLLFISGQVAYGAEGVIGSDLETQLNEAFKNLQTVLHEAGATFEHVVRLTIYVVDYDQSMLPTIRSVRGCYVNMERPPASTLLGVSALFLPGVLVEVEAVATILR